MKIFYPFFLALLMLSCRQQTPAGQREDKIYSRHLQEHVPLTIINTPLPEDHSEWNLLLLNDGQDMEKLDLEKMIADLYKEKKIGPLIVVGIHATDRMQHYGVSGRPDFESRGGKADHYSNFVGKELLPYIREKSGVKKFRSVAMAGVSLGGLSAFDVAWNNSNAIQKAGMFSPAFWWRDKDVSDKDYRDDKNRIVLSKIKASRKSPGQQFWFYAGLKEEESDRDKDGTIDVADDMQDVITAIKQYRKFPDSDITVVQHENGKHDWPDWREVFPEFLTWAFNPG